MLDDDDIKKSFQNWHNVHLSAAMLAMENEGFVDFEWRVKLTRNFIR